MEAAEWFAHRHPPGGASSAHYTVGQDGVIVQSVLEADTAFAAPNANTNGLHIEHSARMALANWTDVQLQMSARLVRHLLNKYKLPIDRHHIKGHVEIPGNNHTDPGPAWPWNRYMDMIRRSTQPLEKPIQVNLRGVALGSVIKSGHAYVRPGQVFRALFPQQVLDYQGEVFVSVSQLATALGLRLRYDESKREVNLD